MSKFLKKLEDRNFDILIYSVLIFFYGLGWDLVQDRQVDYWSVIGVISYTVFVLLLLVKRRMNLPDPNAGEHLSKISPRKDFTGKMVLAAILYGLLVYKLITGFL